MNDAIYLYFVPYGGVPPGITACLARECLQASAGMNGSGGGGGGQRPETGRTMASTLFYLGVQKV